ncbi:MAG: hypothetical protein GXX99_06310 [Clostridiales bacterium]|nr:hypothetical protein [Clostridiales bacterium]
MGLDRYLNKKKKILKNKFGTEDKGLLREIEANYTALRLREIALSPLPGDYDYAHFCAIHQYLFQDIYAWSGAPRMMDICKPEKVLGGKSVDYAPHREIPALAAAAITRMTSIDWAALSFEEQVSRFAACVAELWKVHAFRDGNTRTVVQFCAQYADHVEMPLDRSVFYEHSCAFREALVLFTAVLTHFGDYSDREPLLALMRQAFRQGQEDAESLWDA